MSEIQVTYIGALSGTGKSKAGNQFSLAKIFYAVQSESFHNDKVRFDKKGYEVKELSITDDIFNSIKAKFGEVITLTLEASAYDISKSEIVAVS